MLDIRNPCEAVRFAEEPGVFSFFEKGFLERGGQRLKGVFGLCDHQVLSAGGVRHGAASRQQAEGAKHSPDSSLHFVDAPPLNCPPCPASQSARRIA